MYHICGPGRSVGIATGYELDGLGSNPSVARFSAPVQTSPGAHPVSCIMGTGPFPGGTSGQDMTLTPHPLLLPRSENRVELYGTSTLPKNLCGLYKGETYLPISYLCEYVRNSEWDGEERGGVSQCLHQDSYLYLGLSWREWGNYDKTSTMIWPRFAANTTKTLVKEVTAAPTYLV
jgi:hypothetical protein